MEDIQVERNPDNYNPGDLEMEIVQETDLSGNNIPQEKLPQHQLQSKALRWHMPIIGEIPLSKYLQKFNPIFSVLHSRVRGRIH